MYYYEKDFASEIEDMVMDFLVYRKSRKSQKVPEYKIQDYEVGKGWPYYKDFQLSIEQLGEPAKLPIEESTASILKPEKCIACHEEYPGSSAHMQPVRELPCPKSYTDEASDSELMFFHLNYGEICKCLHVHVKEVIKEYAHDGSPIYEEHINRETISRIVDKVLSRSRTAEEEVEKIMLLAEKTNWSKHHLLCSLVESLTINELCICRRHKQRQLIKNNWDHLEYI